MGRSYCICSTVNAEVYSVHTSCARLTFVPLSVLDSSVERSGNLFTGTPRIDLK